MKKLLTKILISALMLGFFLAPVGIFGVQKTSATHVPGHTAGPQPAPTYNYSGGGATTTLPPYVATPQANSTTYSGTPAGQSFFASCDASPFSITNIVCGIAKILYTLWEVVASITELSAKILDYFLWYSISSDAYNATFIETAWGAVRDIANIFFIISLIYIAIKTILSLNVTNNKKLIGMIIVMALLINFSLFATRVVIDASNILAGIFYQQLDPIDKNGNPVVQDTAVSHRSVTIGLVGQFNPQIIFGQNTVLYSSSQGIDNVGTFILITVLSIFLMAFMIYIFISVAILFVARVVGLWLAMIFSPVAFASYTFDFDIPGFGHKEWWDNLFKNAFMAFIFIFFLYIIFLFGDALKDLAVQINNNSTNIAQKSAIDNFLAVFIPFLIVFIMLKQAKELAVKYSGAIGAMLMKAAAAAGGLALGGVVGGAALIGTGAVGLASGASRKLGVGEWLKDSSVDAEGKAKKGMGAFLARTALKTGDSFQKKSFDIRKTAAGAAFSSATGLNLQSASMLGLGSKEGGWKGREDRKAKELQEESELYKTNMSNDEVKEWSKNRLLDHYKKKDEAKYDTMSDDEKKAWNEKNPPPKQYSSAEELNKDRMNAFSDNLGHSGFIGALASSIVGMRGGDDKLKKLQAENRSGDMGFVNGKNFNYDDRYLKDYFKEQAKNEALKNEKGFDEDKFDKEYEEGKDTAKYDRKSVVYDEARAKKINNEKIGNAKMYVGGGAAVVTGMVTGGILGSATMTGAGIGTIVGGATGASAAYATKVRDDAAEGSVAEKITKQTEKLGNIGNRIKELTDVLNKQKESLETLKDFKVKLTDDPTIEEKLEFFKKDAAGNDTDTIDTDKMEKALAKISFRSKDMDAELKRIREKISSGTSTTTDMDRKKELETGLLELKVKEGQIIRTRGVDEKIARTEKDLFDLKGKKSDIKSGGSAPSAPSGGGTTT